jgi:hypothetical protein
MFSFCKNLMYVIRCILCFILDCAFFYKLNIDCVVYPVVMTDDINTLVATRSHSSDGCLLPIATELSL